MEIYANAVNIEIGGLGRASAGKSSFTVEEIYLVEQKAHRSECEYDDTSIALLMEKLITEGKDPTLNFMWHSHVNMGAFFSPQDKSTIAKWPGDWLVSLVINKKMEMASCLSTVYTVPEEMKEFFSRTTDFKLEPVITKVALPNEQELIAEAKSKVHEVTFQNAYKTNYYCNNKTGGIEEVVDVTALVEDVICAEVCASVTCILPGEKCSDPKLREIANKTTELIDEEEEYLSERYEQNCWEDYSKMMQEGLD